MNLLTDTHLVIPHSNIKVPVKDITDNFFIAQGFRLPFVILKRCSFEASPNGVVNFPVWLQKVKSVPDMIGGTKFEELPTKDKLHLESEHLRLLFLSAVFGKKISQHQTLADWANLETIDHGSKRANMIGLFTMIQDWGETFNSSMSFKEDEAYFLRATPFQKTDSCLMAIYASSLSAAKKFCRDVFLHLGLELAYKSESVSIKTLPDWIYK